MYSRDIYNSNEVVKRTSQEVRFGSSAVKLCQQIMENQDNNNTTDTAMEDANAKALHLVILKQ